MLYRLSVAIPTVSNEVLHLELVFQGNINALGGSLVIVPCLFHKFPHTSAVMYIDILETVSESRYWASNVEAKGCR